VATSFLSPNQQRQSTKGNLRHRSKPQRSPTGHTLARSAAGHLQFCLFSNASILLHTDHHNHFMTLFRDHPGEQYNTKFWTLWCNGRLTEADTQTIQLGTTPSGLSSAHLHHPPVFTGQMAFLLPNHQCQSTEGN